MEENRSAVLSAEVRALTVYLGGIVEGEEHIQQRFVGKAGWIEGDVDDFRVAGAVGTDFFIGWVLEIAAFVSNDCVDNT